ncbi:hypothetical protein D3C80_895610 [compost metagenome]
MYHYPGNNMIWKRILLKIQLKCKRGGHYFCDTFSAVLHALSNRWDTILATLGAKTKLYIQHPARVHLLHN